MAGCSVLAASVVSVVLVAPVSVVPVSVVPVVPVVPGLELSTFAVPGEGPYFSTYYV